MLLGIYFYDYRTIYIGNSLTNALGSYNYIMQRFPLGLYQNTYLEINRFFYLGKLNINAGLYTVVLCNSVGTIFYALQNPITITN